MNETTLSPRAAQVREMFARIAGRYDILNRLMTFGQDTFWRRETVEYLELALDNRVLDVGAGTGDLSFACLEAHPQARMVACDFTREMLNIGKQRSGADRISWVLADAEHLPFATSSFDGVVSGFLLRNVVDLDRVLSEQERILKHGGRFASLDTTPPVPGPFTPLIRFHLHYVIPILGWIVAGDAAAYRYLPASTEAFARAETLVSYLHTAGLESVSFVRRTLGTIAIHRGIKSGSRQEADDGNYR
jgi:demethylmenaquinone methyltransferase/2-methoxy-6-polyprenyl-1,4-benzoquinol methylase